MTTVNERKISSKELAFNEENKQSKASYDPIGIDGSYKKFFNNGEEMEKKEGGYLNKKMVMGYIGTPFSALLKTSSS